MADLAPDVREQIKLIRGFLNSTDEEGRKPCGARCGIYAFYDFDGAAIYVGQTREQLRVRIQRHLTNKRTDAVAMKVLDPMEVATIEVWPFWDLENQPLPEQQAILNRAEYTVYVKLQDERGAIGDLLNEVTPSKQDLIDLPQSHSATIVSSEARERLYHPDERIARRASTIAALAQIVKERDVSLGLRRTLTTQADRLLRLAKRRYDQVVGETPIDEVIRETEGIEGPDTNDL